MSEKRWFWLGMAVLSVLTVRAAWIASYLPTNDGPQHILSAYIENRYSDPQTPIYAETLTPLPQFAYKGFAALYGPLELVFGWRNGMRIALAAMVLGLAWAFAAAVLALEPRRRWIAYLGFALAWMWPLYMGFFAFVVGTAIGFVLVAYAIRAATLSPRTLALLGVGVLVESVAHLVTALTTVGVLGVLVLARAPRDARVRELGKVVLLALVPLAFAVAVTLSRHAPASPRPTTLFDHLAVAPRVIMPGAMWRAAAAIVLVAAGFAFAAARYRELRAIDRAALAIGVAAVLFGALGPRDVQSWQYLGPRTLSLGVLIGLLAVPVERLRADVVGALLFAVSAGSLLETARFNGRLHDGCADALDGLDAPIHRHFLSLPIVIDKYCGVDPDPHASEVPYSQPLWHVGALYAAAQGGSTPYLFLGSAAVHAFRHAARPSPVPIPKIDETRDMLESDAFRSDAAFRRSALLVQLAYGMAYEGIVVSGAEPRDVELFREQGFVVDYARGRFVLAHFQACALDVVVPAGKDQVRIEAGLGDLATPVLTVPDAKPVGSEDGTAHVRVPAGPCGDVWLRCDGAAPQHVSVKRPITTVRCE